jgi:hypothetical protein
MTDGKKRDERIIQVPESAFQGYLAQVNTAGAKKLEECKAYLKAEYDAEVAKLEKRDQEREAKLEKALAEIEAFKKRPLKDNVADFDKETGMQIAEKIRAGAVDKSLAEILPKEIEKRVTAIIELIDGAQPGTMEDTIKRRMKTRLRNRILVGVASLSMLLAVGFTAYNSYQSSRRTADSAVGTADKAKKTADKTLTELTSYKSEDVKWKGAHDETKAREEETRKKEFSGLEIKLAEKVGKTEMIAGMADLKKSYDSLDATLKAELAKNEGRETAYAKYKEFADATKLSLEELSKRYLEFETKAATKEYADEELAKIRKNLADSDTNIQRYGSLIAQLQAENGATSKENANLKQLYDWLLNKYQAIDGKVKKIEEELKK